jgi:glycosyltransferase involved in cell wall biosynthesis
MLDRRRPLSVLHCLWNGEVGGMERAVYQLVREQRHDPALAPAILFAQDRGPYVDATRELGVPIIALDISHGYSAGALRVLISSMRPYDLHHFHAAEPLVMAASLACRDTRRVYTERAGFADRYQWRKRVRYAITGAMLRWSFHALSGNTRCATLSAGERYRIDPSAFHVTHNGLEFELLEPNRPADQAREELGLEASDFVLGTAANIRRWKRLDRLIEAAAALRDAALRVVIVGDGEDRPRLEAVSARLGLGDLVVFAGMHVNIGDYLQVMDAFCLPSMGLESFGNAAIEAMAVGIPTIVFSDGGGMVDHIDPGNTGFVVADQRELEATLRRLIANPGLGECVGQRGRDAVRARYTVQTSARAHKQLYAAALSQNGR